MDQTDMNAFTPEQIEAGRKLFAGSVIFLKGVVSLAGLPPAGRPEVAFAGRSNVGKSSLINALCNRRRLARASNTPGRTQEINFFDVANGAVYLVDLPGYGFAEAPRQTADVWNRLTLDYLRARPSLVRTFLLIDARRGVGEVDRTIMSRLDASAAHYQIVLTKSDKIKASALSGVTEACQAALMQHPAAHPHVIATSSETGAGLPELRALILSLCPDHARRG
jgi:GTP-binding protein